MEANNTKLNLSPSPGTMADPEFIKMLNDFSKAHGPYDLALSNGKMVRGAFLRYDPIRHALTLSTKVPTKINGAAIPAEERQRMANGLSTNTMIIQTKKGPYAVKLRSDGSIIKQSVKKVGKKQLDVIKHDRLLKIRNSKSEETVKQHFIAIKHLLSPAELKTFLYEMQARETPPKSKQTMPQQEQRQKKEIKRSLKPKRGQGL